MGDLAEKVFCCLNTFIPRLELFWGMKLTKKRTLKKKWKRKIFSPQKEWKKSKKHHFLLQKLNILLIKLTFNSLITIFNLKGSLWLVCSYISFYLNPNKWEKSLLKKNWWFSVSRFFKFISPYLFIFLWFSTCHFSTIWWMLWKIHYIPSVKSF